PGPPAHELLLEPDEGLADLGLQLALAPHRRGSFLSTRMNAAARTRARPVAVTWQAPLALEAAQRSGCRTPIGDPTAAGSIQVIPVGILDQPAQRLHRLPLDPGLIDEHLGQAGPRRRTVGGASVPELRPDDGLGALQEALLDLDGDPDERALP